MEQISFEKLSGARKLLLEAASEAMEEAYNPYSGFFVGAALVTVDGKIVGGSNVENAALGSTVCAERSALLSANAMGHKMFKELAIIARGKDFDTTEITGPCGACRQMLFEASQISECDLKIILSTTKKDKIVLTSISELLPLAFGPKDLGIDIEKYQNKASF